MKTLALTIALAACSPVAAQNIPTSPKNLDLTAPCNTMAYVFDLMDKHDEEPFFTGTGTVQGSQHNGHLNQLYPGGLQVWANLDKQTYSITIMFPDGMICLLTSGQNFQTYSGEHPNDLYKKEVERQHEKQKNRKDKQ